MIQYPDYLRVAEEAIEQSANGKGAKRHGHNLPLDQQPMITNARIFGIGAALAQVVKKCKEAMLLEDYDHIQHELLGAIPYLTTAILVHRETRPREFEDMTCVDCEKSLDSSTEGYLTTTGWLCPSCYTKSLKESA